VKLVGSRRRNLLLGVAAFGLLVAALMGVLLVPDGGRDNLVQISLQNLTTNEERAVEAHFSISNRTDQVIDVVTYAPQFKSNGNWSPIDGNTGIHAELGMGKIAKVIYPLPRAGSSMRLPVLCMLAPTRMQIWRARLRQEINERMHGRSPPRVISIHIVEHTNYSAEFSRLLPKSDGD
jgi:hypothetical protein